MGRFNYWIERVQPPASSSSTVASRHAAKMPPRSLPSEGLVVMGVMPMVPDSLRERGAGGVPMEYRLPGAYNHPTYKPQLNCFIFCYHRLSVNKPR